MDQKELIANLVAEKFISKHISLSTAESCTGGNIAHTLTELAGASEYFRGGVVSYTNEIKHNVLGVSQENLDKYTAVSEAVVKEMALGAKRLTKSDFAVSTSGIAGPTGSTSENPIGTVWFGIASPDNVIALRMIFSGTRKEVIAKATIKALELVLTNI